MEEYFNSIVISDDFSSLQRNKPRKRSESLSKTKKKSPILKDEICSGCLQHIVDEDGFYIEQLFEFFHPQCFKCCKCSSAFTQNNPWIPFEGKAYCERDYLKIGAICFGCKTPIKGKSLFAVGQNWHQEHFCCFACKIPIKNGFFEIDGQIFCEQDYINLNSAKCEICYQSIGNTPSVHGQKGQIHISCLKCTSTGNGRCNASPETSKFYTFNSQPICEYHYHYERKTLCPACDTGIDGYCAEVDENTKFHRECWTCAACNCYLEGSYYIHQGGAYCEKDIINLLGSAKTKTLKKRTTFLYNTLDRTPHSMERDSIYSRF